MFPAHKREKAAMKKVAAALARQRALLDKGVEKIVCGKKYETSKFLPDPARIVFLDFEVGRPAHTLEHAHAHTRTRANH